MPIFLSLLRQFWYVVPIVGLFLWGEWWHHEAKDARHETQIVQTKFDAFVNATKEAGLKAQQDNLDKEKLYATNIATANASRADALTRLQLAQAAANSGRRASANNPTAAAGRSEVCFTASGYNAAFKQFGADLDKFIQDARGFAGEGDRAAIDVTTVIRAWPK